MTSRLAGRALAAALVSLPFLSFGALAQIAVSANDNKVPSRGGWERAAPLRSTSPRDDMRTATRD